MSLSKTVTLSAYLFVCSALFAACGAAPANSNNVATQPPANKTADSEFPFSVKEPAVYQGDFYAGGEDYQNKWFVARNGDKWRIDFFTDGVKDRSEIKTDHVYYIDHKRKLYAIEPEGDKGTVQSSYFSTLLSGFFKDKEYRKFESLGNEGDLKKYRVLEENSTKGDLTVYVDPATSMIVKQEYVAHNQMDGQAKDSKYTYEIKNFKTEAPDELFQLPDGYKSIEWNQYAPYAPAEQK